MHNFKHITLFLLIFSVASTQSAWAHFGMLIPSANIVTQEQKNLELSLSFSHPFEMVGMNLEKPVQFGVVSQDKKSDLTEYLSPTSIMDRMGWKASYKVKRPGVYHFYMEPAPYWEPSEDLHIIHYTKTVIAAFGGDIGWDTPIGLPVEIVPLTRPFGNYVNNVFSGTVMVKGQPAPAVEVEIEYYNSNQAAHSASDYHITQVVKTDSNGNFTFACNRDGWWGFSALTAADYTMKSPEGVDKEVELGGVLWIYLDPSTQEGNN